MGKTNRQAKKKLASGKEDLFFLFLCRRQKFLYELNTSGKYFAFKEQLKVKPHYSNNELRGG